MARGEELWRWDEEGCAECGDLHYTPSQVPGLCKRCLDESMTASPLDMDKLTVAERTVGSHVDL